MGKNSTIQCSLSEISLSGEANKMLITGCITKIGEPSTGVPCGPVERRVAFTRDSIIKCAHTFEGQPLDCVYPPWIESVSDFFMGHNTANNIGYLRRVYTNGDNLMAEIVIWKDRNADLARIILMSMDSLGFSVEWFPKKTHTSEDGEIEYMDEFEGCGCALLWRDAAAFSQTFIEKIAASKRKEDAIMTNEEKQALVNEITSAILADDAFKAALDESAKALGEAVMSLKETIVSEIKAANEQNARELDTMKETVEKLSAAQETAIADVEAQKAEIEAIKAAKAEKITADVPAPKAAQNVAANPMMESDKAERIAKINASNAKPLEKLVAITKARYEA